ncbi:ABC transporter ATP-binding protein [Bacillus sp. HNG]|uniref:ABC transporter ATP-binding protein n=1 Tax=Bacillus sp. HNG TaxID=2293325 RepID=UPI000E2EC407|nr:ABC transporter ATP-binding protein [Bacillus sp. HNG]RFB15078.1 ABC transporter ATP-binding protein [Bacillus sp. HNG]
MLAIKNLSKQYRIGEGLNNILVNINLEIQKESWCSIIGPSGSGKSTFLNCISGIIRADQGEVLIDEIQLNKLSEKELSNFRRKNIGFVFQDFKLLPHYSVIDNVMLPLLYDQDKIMLRKKAKQLLLDVGIKEELFDRLPSSLSGGERQRVAIARALIADPKLLLCDEPTGNLDIENRDQITELFSMLKKQGITIIVVTHDLEVAKKGDQVYELKAGILREK